MNMKNVAQLVQETKVVAIVRGLDSGYEQLAQALYDGGIRAIEVTFNQKLSLIHISEPTRPY